MLVSRRSAGSEFQRDGPDLEKSTPAVLLEPIAFDRQSGYITCGAKSARDGVRTEKVRETHALGSQREREREREREHIKKNAPVLSVFSSSFFLAFIRHRTG